MNDPVEPAKPRDGLRVYIHRQASSIGRYWLEQALFLLGGWIPMVIGIGVRSLLCRLILHMEGMGPPSKTVCACASPTRFDWARLVRLINGAQ